MLCLFRIKSLLSRIINSIKYFFNKQMYFYYKLKNNFFFFKEEPKISPQIIRKRFTVYEKALME